MPPDNADMLTTLRVSKDEGVGILAYWAVRLPQVRVLVVKALPNIVIKTRILQF